MGDLIEAFQRGLDEIKNDSYWEGFAMAMVIVRKVFENSAEKEAEALLEEIDEEVDLYAKGG